MPAPTIQFKRGLFVNLPGLKAGEPGFTTDTSDLYIGINSTSQGNKFFGSSRYWQRESNSNNTSAVLKLYNPSGSGSINLNAPVGHSGVTTYTLPSVAPIAVGHFLTADSNGVLSWASVSSNATFDDANLTGITTITYISGTNADFSGIVTSSSFYVDATKVLSTEGGLVTLSGIQTVDSTTKTTLESILKLDPNDFDSLNVSGIGTFTGLIDAKGGLNVTGHTELDNLNVTGFATFTDATFTNAIDADLLGNAGTATSLATARNFDITGSFVTASAVSFDGTGNVSLAATISANSIQLGTYTSGDYVASFTAGGGLTGDASGEGSTPTISVNVGAGITIASDNVAFRNAGSLTDNRLQKWDDTNEQLVNSIISDNGSTATVSGGLTVSGDLTVNGTTTQINTTELTVYDRTITLGIQTGTSPTNTTWDLGVLMNYGHAGVAKTAGVIWEHESNRFQFASNADNPSSGINTTTPDIIISAFASIEVGGLWINNACSSGAKEIIGCDGTELHLMNIVVDGGSFA